MKKPLILFILLFSIKGIAQDPQLFENTWYLNKLVIDNTDYFPPQNNEINNVSLMMQVDYMSTEVCAAWGGQILEFTNTYFQHDGLAELFAECYLQETFDFEYLYIEVFFHNEVQPPFIISYMIEGDETNKVLILTNENGNMAIYGNQPLSTVDIKIPRVVLYPNPVKDVLMLSTQENILSISIYNIIGKRLLFLDKDFENLDLSNLPSGFLLLEIETEKGKVVQKVVKE